MMQCDSMTDDHREIRNLRYRYSRHLDAQEWDEWVSLMTDDVKCEYEGWDPFVGREEVLEFGRDTIASVFEYTAHMVHMPLIEVDGDEATGRWYLYLFYVLTDGAAGWRQGRYEDRYRRVDDEWKFSFVQTEIHTDATDLFTATREWDDHYEKEMYTIEPADE
jgi:ketosteroid isomerase-like protein